MLPERLPQVGELVHLRTRRWLVEEVREDGPSPIVELACADDDNQGQSIEVFWNYEVDRQILDDDGWADIATKGFDSPSKFATFLRTLRWNCVTSTDPNLLQAPFRAGIRVDAYQMEPLRKALRLPRVNLFIADDTGLGKTIEAGLIAQELLLRRKVKFIVVAAPPSVLEQWKTELEDRFGLIFEILDRRYVSNMRRERGFGVNPWRTHSRFLISHNLLIEPNYADPMREWLGSFLPGSLLILDEAHHAAPSSGGRYGIESKFTRAIRDIGGRFEHRLFLSATPHNGHSNSFSTLLELLDPYRFTRGVKVRGKQELEEVMVRRLKEDVREAQGGFPNRQVERLVIDNLPEDSPELLLSALLDRYCAARHCRHKKSSARVRAAAGLLTVGLQQRLLSSIEAFARSLKVHRNSLEKQRQQALESSSPEADEAGDLFVNSPDSDDERGEWSEEEVEREEERQVKALQAKAESKRSDADPKLWKEEFQLLEQMQQVAEANRHLPDAKTRRLIEWIRDNQCPGLPEYGKAAALGDEPQWNSRRVLIFTESREGTKRYLRNILEHTIRETHLADERIGVIDGLTSGEKRKAIQRRFNTDPQKDPLRILIATDAAREGLNFQAHCADLFHFDLPWNPGRIEQRNGRIDRKLQPAEEVRCHYFALPQRVEDRVLEVLVRKTETIKKELGSLSKVIDDDIERRLTRTGIRHDAADELLKEIEAADLGSVRRQAAEEELESARERRDDLHKQIDTCRGLLAKSRDWMNFDIQSFREAISCSLELQGAPPLEKSSNEFGETVWQFPPLDRLANVDSSWTETLDTLRAPRRTDQKVAEWRKASPIRPVLFKDSGVLSDETVHLHLEQRVAQRLLARFRSQGFIHHDLSRACLAQSRDSIPRVLLLGRLSLFGRRAERLHEELIAVAARWTEPERRGGCLKAYAREAESRTLELLEESLGRIHVTPNETISRRLLRSASQDIEELLPQLNEKAQASRSMAEKQLHERGIRESESLSKTLVGQRRRIEGELKKHRSNFGQMTIDFKDEESRQLQADMRHWEQRLQAFDEDAVREPGRLREFYQVSAWHLEPAGLVYMWPETN